MGQEVTVTAMQLIAAISAVANDGVYMQPFVVKCIRDNQNETIKEFSPKAVDRDAYASDFRAALGRFLDRLA